MNVGLSKYVGTDTEIVDDVDIKSHIHNPITASSDGQVTGRDWDLGIFRY